MSQPAEISTPVPFSQPVTGVTAQPGGVVENLFSRKRRDKMTTTRTVPNGLSEIGRRDRVDPAKLLNLIQRIQSASGAAPVLAAAHPPASVAKAG